MKPDTIGFPRNWWGSGTRNQYLCLVFLFAFFWPETRGKEWKKSPSIQFVSDFKKEKDSQKTAIEVLGASTVSPICETMLPGPPRRRASMNRQPASESVFNGSRDIWKCGISVFWNRGPKKRTLWKRKSCFLKFWRGVRKFAWAFWKGTFFWNKHQLTFHLEPPISVSVLVRRFAEFPSLHNLKMGGFTKMFPGFWKKREFEWKEMD